MRFDSCEELKRHGFEGFKPIRLLREDISCIPDCCGVYLILYVEKKTPNFLERGSGGFFKGKDPNVSIRFLQDNWVKATDVIYIGKAGGSSSKATLKTRIEQYLKFGEGKRIGHRGGRLIWQLDNHEDLIVCWKEVYDREPRDYEKDLIIEFEQIYEVKPFANLVY